MKWSVICLVPALAFGAPTKRISPLLIARDRGAESRSLMLEGYMNETLEQFRAFQLKKTDELFGMPKDDAAESSRKRAEHAYEEARAAFDAKDYPNAERQLKTALLEFRKGAAAMTACGHMCETIAMYAACSFEHGDPEEAKQYLMDLNSLSGSFELSSKRYRKELIEMRAAVAKGKQADLRGSLQVQTKPAGARVFVDNVFMGFTPHTVGTVGVGKHLVRVERPGFRAYGELIELPPDQELVVRAELVPSSAYRTYDTLLDKVAAEVARDRPGPAMGQLGKTLGLDRALVGVLSGSEDSHTLELIIGLYDLRDVKKLAFRKLTIQGDEFGQLKAELRRVVTALINNTGNEPTARSSDPLQNKGGTEDWNSEDTGGKHSDKAKKKSGDPLDSQTGTEDW